MYNFRYVEHLLKDQQEDSNNEAIEALEDEAVLSVLKSEKLPIQNESLEVLEEALHVSCQTLIDLSSIPTISRRNSTSNADNQEGYGCAPNALPKWLQYLVICTSFSDEDHCKFYLNCIGTFLELIGLLQSTLLVNKKPASNFVVPQDSNIVIVMMPLIHESHYHCLMRQTLVPQIIASKLWEGLGVMPPVLHLKCVSLLHQLHNIVPNPQVCPMRTLYVISLIIFKLFLGHRKDLGSISRIFELEQ